MEKKSKVIIQSDRIIVGDLIIMKDSCEYLSTPWYFKVAVFLLQHFEEISHLLTYVVGFLMGYISCKYL